MAAEYNYPTILKYGTQANYDALDTKSSDVLYFCTDTGKIFKGSIDFSNNVIVVASKPDTAVAGKLYVIADTNTVEVYAGGKWVVVSYPTTTTIDVNSDDDHVATAKAVYDAIQSAIEDLSTGATTVKSITDDADVDAGIIVTMGDNSTSKVTVTGVVTTPSYDATTRTITLPVAGQDDDVVIALGKDIFVDSTAQNGYDAETGNIVLYLNDGSDSTDPTKIEIPASSLVDVYTGATTKSVKVTVNDKNEVSADVVLRANSTEEGSEFTNGLVLGDTGLYVDLSAYAIASEIEDEIDAVRTTANTADELSKANKSAIDILNGGTDTEGSVAKAVADLKTELAKADEDMASDISDNAAAIEDVTAKTDALVTATTTWGTF
jgi:hypothetical protein